VAEDLFRSDYVNHDGLLAELVHLPWSRPHVLARSRRSIESKGQRRGEALGKTEIEIEDRQSPQ